METNPAQPHGEPHATPTSGERSAAVGQPVQTVYVQAPPPPPRRWLGRLGWIGFFIAVSVILGMAAQYQEYFDTSGGIHEKFHSGSKTARDKIAIIDVTGVIGTSSDYVKHQIDRVRDSEDFKAVVLRVDSPGGTITGSDYIYHHLRELIDERQIPLVVSMGSIAASGGYYVAMAVGDRSGTIFAEPTTTTGSIGVIIPHYDFSGLLDKFDIKDDSLASHPRKRLLSMTEPLSEDDREVLEAYLEDAFTRFKNVVKAGRPQFRENPARLDEIATGEIFSATQAKEHGLVDELGFIEDAIVRAAEFAGLGEDAYRVVEFKAPMSLSDVFATMQTQPAGDWPWQALFELSAPKAYYLSTSLPALAGVATTR